MQSFLAQHGPTIIANGFPIIPIKPNDKAPGKWDGIAHAWGDLWGWQQFCERMPTDIHLSDWEGWPDAGMGIPCGKVVAFDIDVMDPTLAQQIEAFTREFLGDTPLVRFGRRPKRLMVYRAEQPFASFDVLAGAAADRVGTKPLQVLATGRQFVAHGIHPVTQAPYEWPDEAPAAIALEDLPVVTEAQARAWATGAARFLGVNWPPANRGERVLADKELATRAAIEQALSFVPVDSCRSREDWLFVGMAIHAGLAGDGVELWDAWSAGSNQTKADGSSVYDPKALQAQWSAFSRSGPGAIGPGTLFDRAKSFGWHPNGVFLYQHEADAVAAAPAIDFEAMVAAVDARCETALPASEPMPEPEPAWTVPAGEPWWLRDMTGGLRMFVDHARDVGHRDQPLLALAAALPVFGTLAGRRYQTDSKLLTNIYTVGLAGSGGGKEIGNNLGGALLEAAGAGASRGGEELVSGAGIISALQAQPTTFFGLDEFGRLLKAATNARAQNSHASDIFKKLLTLFSASQRTYTGVEHANKSEKGGRPRVAIARPCLSLYGPTNPSTFWSALSSGESVDGTLARMLIFEAEASYPTQRRVRHLDLPPDLVSLATAIVAGANGHDAFPFGSGPEAQPKPYTVRISAEADARQDDFLVEQDRHLCLHEGQAVASVYARMNEMGLKIALIRAITNNPGRPVIELADYDWGIGVSLQCADRMARAIDEQVADNDREADVKAVLKIVRDGGSAGVDRTILNQRMGRLYGKPLDDVIRHLIEGDQIYELQHERADGRKGGRPRRIYHAS